METLSLTSYVILGMLLNLHMPKHMRSKTSSNSKITDPQQQLPIVKITKTVQSIITFKCFEIGMFQKKGIQENGYMNNIHCSAWFVTHKRDPGSLLFIRIK